MKIAVDVALIPPKEVVEKCIAINRAIVKRGGIGLLLGKEKNLPHVTLMQGVMDQSKVANVEKVLAKIASSFQPVLLNATGVNYRELPSPSSVLQLEKTPELQKLHEVVMASCAGFVKTLSKAEVESDCFYEAVSESTVNYAVSFREEHAFQNYRPHITLGKGRAEDVEPFEFTASQLAICHLGSHGTCARVLISFELKPL